MTEHFDLDLFDPNPYQPRTRHDDEHIKALAISIAEQGLLQTPVGRLMDSRVQLAFGHSRLEAFRFLHETGNPGFEKMPVILKDLADEQMFNLAITENAQRRDLTAIETARAMKRYREEFNKTSKEIGDLFGLSESAVRNKIRLLNLPEGVLNSLGNNPVSERVLRELLALFDLPKMARQTSEKLPDWYEDIKASSIVRLALNGGTAEQISNLTSRMVDAISVDMADSIFKHDQIFEGDFISGDFISPDCKSCPMRINSDGHVSCLDRNCYGRKQTAAKGLYLAAASEACGILPIEYPATESHTVTTWWGEKEKQVKGTGCENLRLVYTTYDHGIEGFPHAEICCKKSRGQCVCTRAINAGLDPTYNLPNHAKDNAGQGKSLMEVFAPDHVLEAEPEPTPAPAPLTADQLRQLDREIRIKRRENIEECKAMRADFALRVYDGLLSRNQAIWHWLTGDLVSYQKREKLADAPVDELWQALAEHLSAELYDWVFTPAEPEKALKYYNDMLRKAGLPLMESSVSMETEGVK